MSEFLLKDWKGTPPEVGNSRSSFERLLLFLLHNLLKDKYDEDSRYFRKGKPAFCSASGVESDTLEFISRSFIGAAYYNIHSNSDFLTKIYLNIIKEGTSRTSKFFWGEIHSNQVLVENTSLIIGLLLNKNKFWNNLSEPGRRAFTGYIRKSLVREYYKNNWLWFMIFHYLFLEETGAKNYKKIIEKLISEIDLLYVGGGWYRDGLERQEIKYDHYNSWAFHYYGLMFCYLAGTKYNNTKERLKKRFTEFLDSYLMVFSNNGLPIPWGRSQIYRFGMLSPLGLGIALGIIDQEKIGKIKSIAVNTINEFFRSDILNDKGLLTAGYVRESRLLPEKYSGEGSPYWCLKAFSFLLLKEDHPFWRIDYSKQEKRYLPKHAELPGSICFRIQNNHNGHNLLINGGINSRRYAMQYNRFAYSNKFFAILDSGYADNTFVFLYGGKYLIRDTVHYSGNVDNNAMLMEWSVSKLKKMKASSYIIPYKEGYRIFSNIISPEQIRYFYFGFAVKKEDMVMKIFPNRIYLISGNQTSFLEVTGSAGKFSCKPVPGDRMPDGNDAVMPCFESTLSPGNNLINLNVAGYIK